MQEVDKSEIKFTQGLLQWNKDENNRPMPWKGEKDPYKIWLSEVILQQTRVEQGWKYYTQFVEAFPTVHHLAKAPEQQVFKLWEGLGYYTRCANLIATAKYISEELGGKFPSDYEGILGLKGVGPYTAAAIGSFAFNLPYAVLDGNVYRVLSRVFDIEIPIDTTEGKHYFNTLANKLLPAEKAGEYNQAIMDFGATICKPQPECAQCFFTKNCAAFLQNKQLALPVKEKRTAVKERWFHYFIIKSGDKYAIHQRTEKDIWKNLFEFLLIEGEKKETEERLLIQLEKSFGIKAAPASLSFLQETKQRLSHQVIHFSFYQLIVNKPPEIPSLLWISKADLALYPFPKSLAEVVSEILI
jgi:A/G-specific adenine glycosylase